MLESYIMVDNINIENFSNYQFTEKNKKPKYLKIIGKNWKYKEN